MPKQRYYNLSYEKKQRIIKSTVNEMCRVPMNEMSINKIIQDANISRGSFYQYFDDKYDLIREVISGYKNNMLEKIVNFLTYKNKDIFELFIYMFQSTIMFTEKEKNEKLINNFFNSFKNDIEIFYKITSIEERDKIINTIIDLVDTSNYRYSSKEDVLNLMEIICAIMCKTYVKITQQPNDKNLLFESFKHQLTMIQNGFILKEKKSIEKI